ncbi:GAF domain-containing protein [Nitratidesulfovibrio termitidis]|uniref:GAF domain-containing protein n=1 Tax=Nitratidesulfovibrio termitidis TaxID=42252 RepID=UPI0003FB25EC|nr:GAF domain-containing protein [Nitratidesulfovibrio termitidis]
MNSQRCHERILAIICSVFDAYSAVLFLPDGTSAESTADLSAGAATAAATAALDRDSQLHRLAASFSLGDMVDTGTAIAPGRGLVGWIIRNREPLLVNNFDQRQSHLGYYRSNEEATIKAFMGCPVPGGGALCIDSKRQYSFSDKDQKILQLFADLISGVQGVVCQGAGQASLTRYYAALQVISELRGRISRWPQFLAEFLRLMAEATGFDHALFAARDGDGQNYILEGESHPLLLGKGDAPMYPIGNGIVGWVFRNDAPVYTEGTDGAPMAPLFGKGAHMPAFRSVMCLPLMINKVTRGVLCLGHGEPCVIPDDLRAFTRMSVDHLALFLENLYLKSRLRELLPKARLERRVPAPAPHDRPDSDTDD